MDTIKEWVNLLLEKIENLQRQESLESIWLTIDSQLAYDELVNLLELNRANQRHLDLNSLRHFYEFLSFRWQNIKNTDACYLHRPHSLANQAYLIFAQAMHEVLNVEVYTLLMPPVAAICAITSRKKLDSFAFHELILSDEGIPIEVELCLEQALQNKTFHLHRTDFAKYPLNEQESSRIINHSAEANMFYNAIKYAVRNNSFADIEILRNKFHKTIQKIDYKVTASYGEEGEIRLVNNILKKINTRNDLVNLMIRFVPSKQWKEFVSPIPDDFLERMLLEGDVFVSALQRSSFYTGDVSFDRALLFLFSELYWRRREQLPKYTSPIGWFIEYTQTQDYIRVMNKEDKKKGVDILQNFLMGKEPLSELNNFHQDSLVEGDLSLIVQQGINISDPRYFQKPSKNTWFGF